MSLIEVGVDVSVFVCVGSNVTLPVPVFVEECVLLVDIDPVANPVAFVVVTVFLEDAWEVKAWLVDFV